MSLTFCCFQTSLLDCPFMVKFVRLSKCHLRQREDRAVSSVLPLFYNPATLPAATDRRELNYVNLKSLRVMALSDKAKAVWLLRVVTLKRQAVITRHSGTAASCKLVWNQLLVRLTSNNSRFQLPWLPLIPGASEAIGRLTSCIRWTQHTGSDRV